MTRFLIIFLIGLQIDAQAQQYSNYYQVDINQKSKISADINKNVNVTGNVYEHKTIRTIDYGALELANAQKEKNRLEQIKYSDEKQRRISLEIASDPTRAYDYGYQNTIGKKGKDAKPFGFKKFTMSYRIPNQALFVKAGIGRYENVSSENVVTEIIFFGPLYGTANTLYKNEEQVKSDTLNIGKVVKNEKGEELYVHQKDINRATVYGVKGFKQTVIWEDDYQYTITDNYISFDTSKGNGVMYSVKVRTYGDKDEVTFEELEGRRYYLKRLIEKVVSTAVVLDMKY